LKKLWPKRVENDMRYKVEGAPSLIVPSIRQHKSSCALAVIRSQASTRDFKLKSLGLIRWPIKCNLLAVLDNDGGNPRMTTRGQVYP
jgi:hypothetical protein